ncbi:MAG: hypothetical protein ACRD0C_10780 [Acidimicrobiia bacterium]
MTFLYQARGDVNLQATLASASAGPGATGPHHPITCRSDLRYEGDGTLRCEHASVPPDDLRTRWCVDHSVAVLLIELASLL